MNHRSTETIPRSEGSSTDQPTIADIFEAQLLLKKIVRRTPILNDETLDEALGTRVFVKAEHLQKTGSFKVRGAYNRVHHLSEGEKQRGILTISAGNAAMGAAFAARAHGVHCTVIMPATPVPAKLEAVEALGADVVCHGATTTEMFAKAKDLLHSKGYSLVHPFEQSEVIAGQGTIGLEIMEDLGDADIVLVPASGGGLVAGIALAVKTLRPSVDVIAVQPEGASAIRLSWDAGTLTESPNVDTLADGLIAKRCGRLNFAIIQQYVDDVVLVSDDEILAAMATIWRTLRSAVEPSGAAALAALAQYPRFHDRRVVVVTSGANVDVGLLHHAIKGGSAQTWKDALGSSSVENPLESEKPIRE
jgi:threonine dehydratase